MPDDRQRAIRERDERLRQSWRSEPQLTPLPYSDPLLPRTLLNQLGLAPPGVGAEAFITEPVPGRENQPAPALGFTHASRIGDSDEWAQRKKTFARAFRKIADEIENDRLVPINMVVTGQLEHGEWARNEISFAFEYQPERGGST